MVQTRRPGPFRIGRHGREYPGGNECLWTYVQIAGRGPLLHLNYGKAEIALHKDYNVSKEAFWMARYGVAGKIAEHGRYWRNSATTTSMTFFSLIKLSGHP